MKEYIDFKNHSVLYKKPLSIVFNEILNTMIDLTNDINIVDKKLFKENLLLFSNYIIKKKERFSKQKYFYFLISQNSIGMFGIDEKNKILEKSKQFLSKKKYLNIRKIIKNKEEYTNF
ncbi:MAG: hypothetical protein QXF15_03640, partial [Candidatus Aenigmatarchaeota archaeon]